MRNFWLLTIILVATSVLPVQAVEVLRPLKVDVNRGPNLVANPGFEQLQDGKPVGWASQLSPDWAVDAQAAHGGKASLCLAKVDAGTQFWVSQTVMLNQTKAQPLVVGGWSKAEGVEGSRGPEYSVWVDLQYVDGTPLYGQKATFEVGTHDWQHSEYSFIVSKPVRSATVSLLFRRGFSGKVWFDDISLQELQTGGAAVFDRSPITPVVVQKAGKAQAALQTQDGLKLEFDAQGRPAGLTVSGKSVLGQGAGGLWVRDVGAEGPWLRPDYAVSKDGKETTLAGKDAAAGLALESRWEATGDGIDVHATVKDLTGKDRAVTAYFVLPLADLPWVCHNDMLHSTATTAEGEYLNASGWPISGIASAYPMCSLTAGNVGLSLSVPMDCPRVFRLTYNSALKALYVAVNLGLVKDTLNFPSQADFRFSIYAHDPQWGFRAATEKYHSRHPQFFTQRLKKGGIWMAFADISKVKDWQDFGFAYDEISATPLQFDNDNGITAFRYIEPMTYWLAMAKSYPRTYDGALQALRDTIEKGNEAQKRSASATLCSGVFNQQGKYDVSLQNQSWCDGAVFTLNPDPNIPETPECPVNKGHQGYSKAWAGKNIMPATGPRLDGIYIDSMPNWGEVRNWRREHWKTVEVPLTFDPESRQPVLLQMFSTWQYTNWIAQDVHARGGAMHGNGGALWPFFPALLDTTGQETGTILSHEAMAMARTLLRNKPYSPLLNTQFAKLPPTYMEDYFHRSALYDIFPSFFNGDVFVDGKWQIVHFFKDPVLYERARPLYKQFIPILREMFAAGWQPVTYATAGPAEVRVERYGPGEGNTLLFAVFNDGKAPVNAKVTLDGKALKLGGKVKATALVRPSEPAVAVEGANPVVTVPLEPQRCEVIRIEQ